MNQEENKGLFSQMENMGEGAVFKQKINEAKNHLESEGYNVIIIPNKSIIKQLFTLKFKAAKC